MGKDKSAAEIAAKKEKKEKKRKHDEVEEDVVATPKKEKKSKKSRKSDVADASAMDIDNTEVSVAAPAEEESGEKKGVTTASEVGIAALVPFANPLASEKDQKKVLKSVKKAAKSKAIKRGVKECVKSIRKSPAATPSSLNPATLPPGIVILAADISPMDVISHIPVLCEDHGIPYISVPSRAELGSAGSTKRPTSVVMITPTPGKGAADSAQEWKESFAELNTLARKLGSEVTV